MATPQGTVTYRDIPGHPGYRVGDDGSVWCNRGRGGQRGRVGAGPWRLVAQSEKRRNGKLRAMTVGLASRTHAVHALVLLAFVGQAPAGMEGCHNDGDPRNNRLDNLRWDTRKANAADMERHGTVRRGGAINTTKLTPESVRSLRARFAAGGVTVSELSRETGLSRKSLSDMLARKSWAHVE